MNRLWVVSYDISDDKIRKKVHDILKNHGEPVQFSVFECHLNRDDLERLREQVADLLNAWDSVRWYPLCVWCNEKIACQGRTHFTENPGYFLV